MIENIPLPDDLLFNIGSERVDFAIKPRHAQPVSKSVLRVVFGIIWLAFIIVPILLFFGPGFRGNDVQMVINGVTETFSRDNIKPFIFLFVFFAIFIIIGLSLVISGILLFFKSGDYFAATPSRLIQYRKGNIKSVDWEQFSGNINVRVRENYGNITMELRTGRMVSSKSGNRYIPDIIYISGVRDIREIEQICRKRIKENDPTKAVTT